MSAQHLRGLRPAPVSLLIAVVLLAAMPAGQGALGASLTSTTYHPVIDVSRSLATVPDTAVGINTAVWDGYLMDSSVPGLIRGTSATVLRFPGGSTSDTYDWQTNSIVPGQSGSAGAYDTFDAFMTRVEAGRSPGHDHRQLRVRPHGHPGRRPAGCGTVDGPTGGNDSKMLLGKLTYGDYGLLGTGQGGET